MCKYISIGDKSIKISQDQYNSMVFSYYNDNKAVINNSKYKIEYIISIYIDDPNNNNSYSFKNGTIDETYYNLMDAMIRMYNLKIIGMHLVDMTIKIKNNNKIIIEDYSLNCDFFYNCLNFDTELRTANKQIKTFEAENNIYKEFITKYHLEKTFEEFKKDKI